MIDLGFNYVEPPKFLNYNYTPIAYEVENEFVKLVQKKFLYICPMIFISQLSPRCTMCYMLPCAFLRMDIKHESIALYISISIYAIKFLNIAI